MSALADSALVLGSTDQQARPAALAPSRPAVRVVAFAALGLYGGLRWSTLLVPMPSWRLLALLGLAVSCAGALPLLARRGPIGRLSAGLAAVLVALAALLLSGVPFGLIRHAHVGSVATGIGQGLAALPRVTVPYAGINDWARITIMLGAAVLMLDAGMVLAFAPARLGDARRAGAALPLIALAVIPSTLIRPSLPYVHGLVLLILVAALVWGERLRPRGLLAAVLVTCAAGGSALVAAPVLDSHHPWLNYESLAGAFSPAHVERFDWSQRYGPLIWPRTGREMLDVHASRADYWKAANLDTFNGVAWVPGAAESGALLPSPGAGEQARWTQTLRVTLRGMQSTDLIAAGYASEPQHAPTSVLLGDSPGTWTASVDLGPGDSYLVKTYSPRPSPAELAAASLGSYPNELLAGYRSLTVPSAGKNGVMPEVVFAPFGSSAAVAHAATQPALTSLVMASPYGRAYALAQQLAQGARTPYAFIERVQRYLAHGYIYSENAPTHQFPLASFLFTDRLGYCQQFSGAMALLLRMGGVPARVAAGFTPGNYDSAAHQWVVSDLDAHSWVEAWFPGIGWVRFDPTPAAAPALRASSSAAKLAGSAGHSHTTPPAPRRIEPASHAAPVRRRSASGAGVALLALLAAALGALAVALVLHAPRRGRSAEQLVAELERALARSGRPLAPGTTLAQLEQRFRSSPAAAGYLHALRDARYGTETVLPSPAGRRALRARLADGLGLPGHLRAWWALPPCFGAEAVRRRSHGH